MCPYKPFSAAQDRFYPVCPGNPSAGRHSCQSVRNRSQVLVNYNDFVRKWDRVTVNDTNFVTKLGQVEVNDNDFVRKGSEVGVKSINFISDRGRVLMKYNNYAGEGGEVDIKRQFYGSEMSCASEGGY